MKLQFKQQWQEKVQKELLLEAKQASEAGVTIGLKKKTPPL